MNSFCWISLIRVLHKVSELILIRGWKVVHSSFIIFYSFFSCCTVKHVKVFTCSNDLWKSKMRARPNLLTIIGWRHINIMCLQLFLGNKRLHQTVVTLAWFIVYTMSAALLFKGNASVEKKQNTKSLHFTAAVTHNWCVPYIIVALLFFQIILAVQSILLWRPPPPPPLLPPPPPLFRPLLWNSV